MNESKPQNLIEGLLEELNRNRELLKDYEDIGPAGTFGAMFIRDNIEEGERAIASGDVVQMLRIYSTLQNNS